MLSFSFGIVVNTILLLPESESTWGIEGPRKMVLWTVDAWALGWEIWGFLGTFVREDAWAENPMQTVQLFLRLCRQGCRSDLINFLSS